ncbi:MAG: metallophosphoesterase [Candidatus Eisenbacteria sp.]|nr:metallophosphoesterase [Candidatus Eisenbacteria bacterium]
MALEPLTVPWVIQPHAEECEIRLLVSCSTAVAPEAPVLLWQDEGSAERAGCCSMRLSSTPLGPAIRRASASMSLTAGPGAQGGSRLRYRVRCGELGTPWILLQRPQEDPGTWRFLLLSDHQLQPGVLRTLTAIRRQAAGGAFNGLLFAGDLTHIPDRLESWAGDAQGRGFFDSLGAPVAHLFLPESKTCEARAPTGWPLISTLPCVACPGNHEVSSGPAGGSVPVTAEERFRGVTPGNWTIATFAALFLPDDSGASWRRNTPAEARAPGKTGPMDRPGSTDKPGSTGKTGPPEKTETPERAGRVRGWYRTRIGPVDVISLFAARRWVRGDHDTRTGPCYEPPGRFTFASVQPGAPQYEWLRGQIEAESVGEPDRRWITERARPLRIVLAHHPPFAQGYNARPPFGDPIDYAGDHLVTHLVPLFEQWADLVIGGHNHAVNHHHIRGVHYFESSHMGAGFPPACFLPDGRVAPEPHGHPSLFFASESDHTFYSVLEVRTARRSTGLGQGGRIEADANTESQARIQTRAQAKARAGPKARAQVNAKVTLFRVLGEGHAEEAYSFEIGSLGGRRRGENHFPAGAGE